MCASELVEMACDRGEQPLDEGHRRVPEDQHVGLVHARSLVAQARHSFGPGQEQVQKAARDPPSPSWSDLTKFNPLRKFEF